jgi:2-methylcitrate dehydratase PrpD
MVVVACQRTRVCQALNARDHWRSGPKLAVTRKEESVTTLSPTKDLAQFVTDLRYEDIPEPVRERVKDIVLDALASALAGHDASETAKIVAMANGVGASEEASVIGGGRLSTTGATMVNGYLITAVTVCDVHRPTSCHVCPEVLPPALATAEGLGSAGRDFLVAVAAGLEITTRVGLGLDPAAFRARGWHAPGVTGPFGGAAAAGKLLGLDAGQQCSAFGIAGSQAAGTYAQLGTPTIKFQQSHGAVSGLIAAKLAQQGFGAAAEILMHPDGGLFSAYAAGGKPEAMLAGLVDDWELMRISLRAWPVAVHLQPVVTGLMKLIVDHDVQASDLTEVRLGISETAYRMHGTVNWDDRFRARLSAPYVTGVVIHDRRCWLEQFTPERVQEPSLNAFIRDHVKVHADRDLEDGTATLETFTRSGATHRERVTVAKGEPSNPLTHEEIVQKFRSARTPRISSDAAERAIEMVSRLETLGSMRDVADILRASPKPAAVS